MSLLGILRQGAALAYGEAVPRASVRHVHLVDEPFVVAIQVLAGEPFAPLAIVWGTDPGSPAGELVIPEPRNRDLRYQALGVFADALLAYLQPYEQIRMRQSRTGAVYPVCDRVPQIIVPTSASAVAFCEAIGRGVLYSPTAPDPVRRAGSFATFLSKENDRAGQALLVAATRALSTHWATGQADVENENLAALLSWIEPDPAAPPQQRLMTIKEREQLAWGPLRRPEDDEDLVALVQRYNRAKNDRVRTEVRAHITAEVLPAVRDAYRGTHHAVALLRQPPLIEAPGAADRWESDRTAWARFAQRWTAETVPRFSTRDGAEWAVRIATELEDAVQNLPAVMAFDDPLIMAEYVDAGVAIAGTVLAVDLSNREVKPGNQVRTRVPLVTVRTDRRPAHPVQTRMRWADDASVVAEIRSTQRVPIAPGVAGDTLYDVEFAVMGGHRNGTTVPVAGTDVVFAALDPTNSTFRRPGGPAPVPWTHQPAVGATV